MPAPPLLPFTGHPADDPRPRRLSAARHAAARGRRPRCPSAPLLHPAPARQQQQQFRHLRQHCGGHLGSFNQLRSTAAASTAGKTTGLQSVRVAATSTPAGETTGPGQVHRRAGSPRGCGQCSTGGCRQHAFANLRRSRTTNVGRRRLIRTGWGWRCALATGCGLLRHERLTRRLDKCHDTN